MCAKAGHLKRRGEKKRLGILGRTNVRFLVEIHPAALHLARGRRATNTACFKSGTFDIGVAGEYCF